MRRSNTGKEGGGKQERPWGLKNYGEFMRMGLVIVQTKPRLTGMNGLGELERQEIRVSEQNF